MARGTRALEPYGYRDQDNFDPNSCPCENEIKQIHIVDQHQQDDINKLLSGYSSGATFIEELSAYTVSSVTRLDKTDDELWDALDAEISARTSGDTNLQEQIDENTEDIERLDDELNNATSGLSGVISSLSASIFSTVDGLSGKVDSLSASIFSTVDGLSGKVDSLSASIFSTVDGLSGKVDSLSASIFSTVDGLSGQVINLTNAVSGLSGSTESLSGRIDTLDDELNNATSGLTSIIINLSGDVYNEITEINTSINVVSAVTSGLVTSAVTFAVDIDALKKKDIVHEERFWDDEVRIANLEDFSGEVITSAQTLEDEIQYVSGQVVTSVQTLENEIQYVSGATDDLTDALAQEIQDRKDADDALSAWVETTYITSAQSVADDNELRTWVANNYITSAQSWADDEKVRDWVRADYITDLSAHGLVADALETSRNYTISACNNVISAYTAENHDLSDKIQKNADDIIVLSDSAKTNHDELHEIIDGTTETGQLFKNMNSTGTTQTVKISDGNTLQVWNENTAEFVDVWSLGENRITVDESISNTSKNPVQNKVIKNELDSLSTDITDLSATVGNLGSLTTTDKTSIVNAINSLVLRIKALEDKV